MFYKCLTVFHDHNTVGSRHVRGDQYEIVELYSNNGFHIDCADEYNSAEKLLLVNNCDL